MHEVSVCQSILNTIEDEFNNDGLENIREIHLKVGMLSCIEPGLLKNVFKYIKVDGPFQKAELFVELVEVRAECENCGEKFKVEQYRFVCPKCESPVSNIIEGKELLIHKIISEEPSYAEINE
jgi:hydrogenase nickel incorporation protein HypA/HybF